MEQHSNSVGNDQIAGSVDDAKNTIIGNHNRQSIREDASDRRQQNEITINDFSTSELQAIYAKLARLEDNFNWRMTRLEDNMDARITFLERENERLRAPNWGQIINSAIMLALTLAVSVVAFELIRLAY